MDSIPPELLAHILVMAASSMSKNSVLKLRLVCKPFDAILKPIVCETLNIDMTRLSRLSGRKHPTEDALQTIGYRCKGLYIDLMILRDELEVELLPSVVQNTPAMNSFCELLQTRYCLHTKTFTEEDYSRKLEAFLFNCRNVERLRLNLPIPLLGRHSDVATWMLAITFRALSRRPEEDSARMKTLVLENVTDDAICKLWRNPVDVKNIMFVMEELEHLIISTRRREPDVEGHEIFSACFWDIVRQAESLDSLCLIGMETEPFPTGLCIKRSYPGSTSAEQWRILSLPVPTFPLFRLTRLELRRVDVHADFFDAMAHGFGQSLRELYLSAVCLKVWTRPNAHASPDPLYPCPVLWVGVPHEQQKAEYHWVATTIRKYFKKLEVCRASELGYDVFGSDADLREYRNFDLKDPCSPARTLDQRFVEVVLGYEQPIMRDNRPFSIGPAPGHQDLPPLVPRPKSWRYADWNTLSYQNNRRNPTSRWLKSLDGLFTNRNEGNIEDLHRIAQTACDGMDLGQGQRRLGDGDEDETFL